MSRKSLEKFRKAELKSAIKSSGFDRKEFRTRFELGGFGGHELLDRSQLVGNMFDDFILSHPAALMNPDLYQQATKVSRALAKLYQMVGAVTLTSDK